MCFNLAGDISTLEATTLQLADKFTYLGSSVSSAEKDFDTRLTKAWTAIDKVIRPDRWNESQFLPGSGRIDTVVWMHHLNANKTAGEEARRRQNPTKHQLYGHLPHITKTIQVRRTRHAGHCWRSRDHLISDVLRWIPISLSKNMTTSSNIHTAALWGYGK